MRDAFRNWEMRVVGLRPLVLPGNYGETMLNLIIRIMDEGRVKRTTFGSLDSQHDPIGPSRSREEETTDAATLVGLPTLGTPWNMLAPRG